MTLMGPEPLNKGHLSGSFDCGKTGMNDWLKRHALQAQTSGSARTFIVTEDRHVVGYYTA